MSGNFDAWLGQLAISKHGPVTWIAARHTAFSTTVTLEGDWTGATMRGQIRSAPDAATALATFTIGAASVSGGNTTFAISLAKATVTALAPDGDGDGVSTLVFDILLDPAASAEGLLFGGLFKIMGGATQ